MSDEIRDLLARYALALDTHDVAAGLAVFTEDAEFVAYGKTYSGHSGIGAMFDEAPRGLHLLGATSIDVVNDTATARSQVLFSNATELRPGHYEDELVRRDGTWLIRRRQFRRAAT